MSGYIVYGQKGSGSVLVEAALRILGEPYRLIERMPEESPGQGDLRPRPWRASIRCGKCPRSAFPTASS